MKAVDLPARARGRRLVVAAGVLLAVAGVGSVWWIFGHTSSDESGGSDAVEDERDAADPFARLADALGDAVGYDDDRASADQAAATLVSLSGDDDVRDAVAPGTLEEAGGSAAGSLPNGARVVPEPDTWYRLGNIAGMVASVAFDDRNGRDYFLVWFVRDSDDREWLISHTEALVVDEASR